MQYQAPREVRITVAHFGMCSISSPRAAFFGPPVHKASAIGYYEDKTLNDMDVVIEPGVVSAEKLPQCPGFNS